MTKVTIQFGEELDDALQYHFDTGESVQNYIKAAIRYFNIMRQAELNKQSCGYGDNIRFGTYNHVENPSEYISGEK